MTYDTTGQVTSVTDPAGNKTSLSYADNFYYDNNADPPATYPSTPPTNAYLTQVTQPSVNSNSFVTKFGYYFGTGQTAKSVDVNSQATYVNYYDPFSRPTQSVPPIGWSYTAYTSATQIDSCSGISATLNPNYTGCIHTQLALDTLGRPHFSYVVNNPDGQTTASTSYDSDGRVQTVSAPYPYGGSATAYDSTTYDRLDRPTSITHADGASVSYSYGAGITGTGVNTTQLCSSANYGVGYPTLVVDEAGKRRESWTDGFGRLIEVDEPDSTGALTVNTCNKYNLANNLTEVDEGVQTRTYGYDLLGRVTSVSIPETTPTSGSQKTSYSNYDSDSTCAPPNSFAGQLVSTVDARGVRTCMQYDALNRVTQVSYIVTGTGVTSTPTAVYHYDAGGASAYALGRLTSLDDALGSGSESYSYDQLGRVTQLKKIISSVTYTTSYAYNAASELTSIAYPAGGSHVVQSGYDAIGRLCAVAVSVSNCTPSSGKYASSFSYNAPGQLTGFTYGNNSAVASIGYSATRLQLTSLGYVNGSTTLLSLAYGYPSGNNGQITSITDNTNSTNGDSGRTATYAYDPLARLSRAYTAGSSAYPAWDLSWTYDRYGNRLTQSVTSGSNACTGITCPTNSLTFSSPPGGAQTNHPDGFTFDANGNMLNDGLNTLTYDAANHLISTSGGLASGSYIYDGNGLRVEKISGGTSTTYIFSGGAVIAEYSLGANPSSPSKEYVYSGGQLIATVDPTTTKYHLRDHLSVRLNIDSSGNIIGEQGHFPFGEPWYEINTTTKWKFTTYERDPESGTGGATGNDYVFARYDSNRLGRFISIDPLAGYLQNPQSLNRYGYVLNDPCNSVDILGLDPCAFNILVKNAVGMDPAGLQAAEKQFNVVLGANNSGLSANFVESGNADFTANLKGTTSPAGRYGINNQTIWQSIKDIVSGSLTNNADIYVGNIYNATRNMSDLAFGVGQTMAHEFGHFALQIHDNPVTPSDQNGGIMQQGDVTLDPKFSSHTSHFDPSAIPALQKLCNTLQKNQNSSGGGGGGSLGGLATGGLFFLSDWVLTCVGASSGGVPIGTTCSWHPIN
jgi:RHS repeat-associated protein